MIMHVVYEVTVKFTKQESDPVPVHEQVAIPELTVRSTAEPSALVLFFVAVFRSNVFGGSK